MTTTAISKNDIIATSWDHLNGLLFEVADPTAPDRYRSKYVFRGCASKDYDLSTSLIRLAGDYAVQERRLLRNFKKYINWEKSEWEMLALAQHHGLPTRLLDWTYSPYVALHFATAETDKSDLDGVIWCIDYREANKLVHDKLRDILKLMDSEAFTVEMLSKAATTLDEFENKYSTPGGYVIVFEPPSLDDRIVNQFGLFSMTSHAALKLDTLLAAHPQLCRRVIIPSKLKWEVRDKLDQANITERILFPGLDGLSTWLKRYYIPRTQAVKPKAISSSPSGLRNEAELRTIDEVLLHLRRRNVVTAKGVHEVINVAIQIGGHAYDSGSPKSCAEIYLHTIKGLLDILLDDSIHYDGQNRRIVVGYLHKAVSDDAVDALAWGLRRTLDIVLLGL